MGKRLLVVDSDRRFIQDHKSPLESAFEVDFLYTTEGALTRLESGQYGGILLCVETSENKGYALCSAIRRAPMHADLKIALISAKASEEEYSRHRGTKGKADLYLHKPINTTALIPALAELVPMKEDDPDNPLGDLAGADLGDEWLESLRTELETEPAPAPRTIAPIPGWAAEPPPAPEKPIRNQGEIELLEWRVKDLELKLSAQHDELERKTREIEELIQRNAAVTRNLDDIQHSQGEAEALRHSLQERTAAEDGLRGDLQDALDEQKRLVEQLDEVNALLSEKNQQNAELMESHQLLQAQLEEAWEAAAKVKDLEASLSETQETLRTAGAQAALAEQHSSDLLHELEGVRADAAVKQARIQELEGAQGRVAELEAELASAREQVAFQEQTQRDLAEARAKLEAECAAKDDELTEQAGEIFVLQEKLSLQEATSRDLREERDTLGGLREQLERAANDLQARLDTAEAAGESQRREFLAGIEEREANLGRLHADLDAGQDRINQLNREKADLAAELQGRQDRLDTIGTVLAELGDKARQALDLAKG
ncbi:hypothetical protein [Geothrix sp. 21YS21S-2]|uniref:hypothetical protein n=1 Tax=Geothrix sp. 21YS21S-2 TaxID=3068893 RepID=UPI0027BAB381|nr:hypothetical protein [Geothrix sp. 21YS21S-2]